MNPRLRAWLSWLWWGDAKEATLGRRGERAAAAHLKMHGYRLLRRNLRLRPGEVDLLMLAPDGRTLVIVEVKTKAVAPSSETRPAPPPEASVHAHKRDKLLQLRASLSRSRRYRGMPIRIDVVGVDWAERGEPMIRHHPDAVRG
ncbi:MAG: YraN family protein [Planctomycetes bacterium]|nr:YraN family protein [Planctomycetota bacterium]